MRRLIKKRLKAAKPVLAVLLAPWLLCSHLVLAHGNADPLLSMISVDQLEWRHHDGEEASLLAAEWWLGHDESKFHVLLDVERHESSTESIEWQGLYSKALSAYWDGYWGVRKDALPTPDRHWLVMGAHGLAPYFIDVDIAMFLGESNRSALRLTLEKELKLTQRWVLMPELEWNIHARSDEAVGVGRGLSDSEVSLRLAYELRREASPYIGVSWERAWAETADIAKAEGEERSALFYAIGLSFWF